MNKKLIKTFGALAGIGAIASAATFSLTSCGADSLTLKTGKTSMPVATTPSAAFCTFKLNSSVKKETTLVWEIRKEGTTADSAATLIGKSGAWSDADNAFILTITSGTTQWIDTDKASFNVGFKVAKTDTQAEIVWKSLATIKIA